MAKKRSKKNNSSKKNNPSRKISTQSSAFQYLENDVKKIKTEVQSNGIPKYVADRMARRIFFTAGIPTLMGMSVFVVSYIIVTRKIAEIPPSSTIAISALFFILGLGGLSYGILSASWDINPGSFLGLENIPLNIQRAKAAFKPASQNYDEIKKN